MWSCLEISSAKQVIQLSQNLTLYQFSGHMQSEIKFLINIIHIAPKAVPERVLVLWRSVLSLAVIVCIPVSIPSI